MSNVIKYTTTPVNDTIKKGNFALGVNDVDYGPTNITGFYATTIPSTSGYTIYNQSGGTLSYQSVSGTTALINYLSNKRGVNMTTAGEALSWAAGQSSIFVTNREYENIVTSGMVLNLDAGFVSSYPTSATTWYDLSYSGNNGTLTNGPTFNSFNGGSIVFDGVDDYVNCGNANSLKITGPLTINTIFKANALNIEYQPIVAMGDDSYRFQRNASTNKLAFGTRNLGLTDLVSNTSISVGSWYTASAVYNGSSMQIYINGVLDAIGSASGTLPISLYNLWIGRNAQVIGRLWNGNISTVQIYNRGLSPFEVYQNYNAMKGRFGIPDIVTSGLTLNMDAGNPYSYNPLNTGSTTWVNTTNITSGGTLTNGTFYSGGTMVFDGVDDYVIGNTPNNINLSQPCSINTWVLFNSFNTVNPRIIECQDSSNSIQLIRDESTGKIATKNSNFQSGVNGNTWFTPTTNVWYNISVVWTPSTSTTQLYLNGLIQTGSTFNNIGIGDKPNKITLGVRSDFVSSTWLNGKIGNVQVYNRALNPIEIYQNFNALKNRYGFYDMVQEGLVLNLDASNPNSYNPLNTGSTTWTDVSGNGNNGTLTNGASYTDGTIFLDGTDDYVNCGTGSTLTFNNGTNLNDIPFTIGVWVKFNSVSGYQLVIAKSDYGSSPNKREFLFFTNADSRIHINLMNSDNYNNRIGRYYNTVLSTNTWYHMFATYDGSKLESGLKIYINGARVDDTSDSTGTYSGLSRTTTPFSFGTDWNNYPNQGNKLSGYYGLGQVYRRELSVAEIQQNFNATRGRYGV